MSEISKGERGGAHAISFSPPVIGDEEIEEVIATLKSGWLSRGPRTSAFEQGFAAYVGARAALALSSCTAGLHLALLVLDIGPGDEVLVPTMTFCACANVVEHVGATPVFVDVDRDTLNMSPDRAAAAVTGRTRAMIIVHYAGHPADVDALRTVADRHGLRVVEDAAHALPASYRGRMVGAGNGLTAFSFYATKNLTTGEGGMLTGAPRLVEAARLLSLHGMSGDAWGRYSERGSWYYEVMAPGYKYNMSDVQAALGLRQLERLDAMQIRRREIVARYDDGLREVSALRLPRPRGHVVPAWHLYPVRVTSGARVTRGELIDELSRRRIGTSVHFIPLHLHPFYRDKYVLKPEAFPVAQTAYEELVSLPLHAGLTDNDVARVIDSVREILA